MPEISTERLREIVELACQLPERTQWKTSEYLRKHNDWMLDWRDSCHDIFYAIRELLNRREVEAGSTAANKERTDDA